MQSAAKRTLHGVGTVLCCVGIGFVLLRIRNYTTQIDIERFDRNDAYAALGLALLYGLSNGLLARAWWNLLAFKNILVPWSTALRIYGLSQLAKYVPGNIFHVASRQSLGLAAGMPGWALAKSAVWELALLTVAGAMFTLLTLPMLWPEIRLQAAASWFLLIFLAATAIAWRQLGEVVARAFVWQGLFLVLSGAVFLGAIDLVTRQPIDAALIPGWCAAYIAAWLAGLVTPGAPGGLGVRELVLFYFFDDQVAEADLSLAVVVGRLVTISGDVLFFLAALTRRSGS